MAAEAKKEFVIESIWSTSVKFDAITPVHKLMDEWQPAANLDLDVQTEKHGDKHVVKLIISVNVKIKNNEVFNLESTHTAVFNINGYEGDELNQILNSFCPGIIYPYAREKVSSIVSNAGYPPLHLSPVDFDARYRALSETSKAS
ncbi:protein-export chaperone SecB [Candidatus Comchoanobacter bicostacola]|uniref:Protein-export chaperone SecB n=1 Tax=Candidatus Comchoanobacter bicostacola TaxID=2919598 RepID=A0ABY5DK39_9GAMM|nr:protein-export chaperone SecB [Candidatus Comchoanobacter bicostacola]UTC24094.1 protein-export chaperone SecB [Candidatus Comchoanobacter bicostacola]